MELTERELVVKVQRHQKLRTAPFFARCDVCIMRPARIRIKELSMLWV